MTLQQFNALAFRDRLTLFNFYALWCGPCRAMHPALDHLADDYRQVEIIRLDIDEPENVEIVRRNRIMSVPTLILFRKGRVLWRESGLVSFDALADVVRRYERVGVL